MMKKEEGGEKGGRKVLGGEGGRCWSREEWERDRGTGINLIVSDVPGDLNLQLPITGLGKHLIEQTQRRFTGCAIQRNSGFSRSLLLSMSTLSFLRNKYWVLRHGKSIPNERGLIVSSVEKGVLEEYGLAQEGVGQAQLAGELLLKELQLTNTPLDAVRICYSPFSRTTQTAKTVANELNLPFESPQCKVIENLRERYFGPTFELLSHEKYSDIWALDEKDPFLPPDGGESVANVVSRLAAALESLEAEFDGCTILIVSHGDPLQILQTILHAANQLENACSKDLQTRIREVTNHSILSQHRKFALLTGELREIK
ncbi:hypothetical protein H6P81_005545 [Aristolochia fimbriata]|uniref:Uncharacterized protein n=1 Tax=Aristolochia fimbriata TaxID=158543 RepID=A0AAV7EYH5_ARIFI|nr:hypothetical protein H6P81_005545 [Aristolochia fimbriata]